METALIGLVGLLAGILITEHLRRAGRIEYFAREIFERRLSAYEGLYAKMNEVSGASAELLEKEALSDEERNSLWGEVVLRVAQYTDEYSLYLDDRIIVHCVGSLVGFEDIAAVADPASRKAAIDRFLMSIGDAKMMIRQMSGMSEIERSLHALVKSRPKSALIDYYEHQKKVRER
jgi:hypothetical protein